MVFSRNTLKNNEMIGIFSRDSKGIIKNIQTNEIILGAEDEQPELVEVVMYESEKTSLQFLIADSSKVFASGQQLDINNISCELPKAFRDFYDVVESDKYYYILFDLNEKNLYRDFSNDPHNFAMFAITKEENVAEMVITYDFYRRYKEIFLMNDRIFVKYKRMSSGNYWHYSEISAGKENSLSRVIVYDQLHKNEEIQFYNRMYYRWYYSTKEIFDFQERKIIDYRYHNIKTVSYREYDYTVGLFTITNNRNQLIFYSPDYGTYRGFFEVSKLEEVRFLKDGAFIVFCEDTIGFFNIRTRFLKKINVHDSYRWLSPELKNFMVVDGSLYNYNFKENQLTLLLKGNSKYTYNFFDLDRFNQRKKEGYQKKIYILITAGNGLIGLYVYENGTAKELNVTQEKTISIPARYLDDLWILYNDENALVLEHQKICDAYGSKREVYRI